MVNQKYVYQRLKKLRGMMIKRGQYGKATVVDVLLNFILSVVSVCHCYNFTSIVRYVCINIAFLCYVTNYNTKTCDACSWGKHFASLWYLKQSSRQLKTYHLLLFIIFNVSILVSTNIDISNNVYLFIYFLYFLMSIVFIDLLILNSFTY